MRTSRLLLLTPAMLLVGAASPVDDGYWYSIATDDGVPVGYGFTEATGTLDALTLTDYRELTIHRPNDVVLRITDRRVVRRDKDGRPIEITERIDNAGNRTDIHSVIERNEAVVTRTTPAGQQVKRIALPARVFESDMSGPSRCPPPTYMREPLYELDVAEMALDRVVDDPMLPGWEKGLRYQPRRRMHGSMPRSVERLGYDGGCHLREVIKLAFGITVRIKPGDRETVLKGFSPAR